MGKVLLIIILLLGGCVSQKPVKRVNLELREVGDSLRVNYKIMVTKDGKASYPISNKILMTGEHIERASVEKGIDGSYEIFVVLDTIGAKKFSGITLLNVGKKLAIILNGELINAPQIMTQITGGTFVIAGNYTKEEAEKLARGLAPQD